MSSEQPRSRKNEKLCIPYAHVSDAESTSRGSVSQMLPIAAMLMKSKILAWASVLVSITAWLNEPDAPSEGAPAAMNIVTSVVSIFVAYMDFVFTPRLGTAAPAAATPEASA